MDARVYSVKYQFGPGLKFPIRFYYDLSDETSNRINNVNIIILRFTNAIEIWNLHIHF